MPMILRDYQTQAVASTLAALKQGCHPVISLPTGSGKALCLAALCQALPGRLLQATHVKELLEQNAAELLRFDPSQDVGLYSAGLEQRHTQNRIIIGGVQSIYTRMELLQKAGMFQYVLIDECFPAGTLIDGRPIETYAPGDTVWSFNHQTNTVERKIIQAVFCKTVNDLLTITSDSGIMLSCTPNHPFWTGGHYIEAKNLVQGASVFTMPFLRKDYRNTDQMAIQEFSSEGARLLRRWLRNGIQKTAIDSERIFSASACYCQRAHANQQPNEATRNSTESEQDFTRDWPSPSYPWWQWPWDYRAAEKALGSTGRRMASRISCTDRYSSWRELAVTDLVFTRLGVAAAQDSHRDRWQEPSCAQSKSQRCEEGWQTSGLRMDRVASIEQASIRRHASVPVYNLEIAGNNNYFAERILVHNCHRIAPRDAEAKLYNAVFAACTTAQRIGLTATPYRLDGGLVYGKDESWFDCLAHETGMRELTPEYLAPLRGVLTAHDVDTAGVRTRHGDFVTSDVSQIACEESLVEQTVEELCWLARKRQRWLVFCVDLAHTALVTDELKKRGIVVGTITGDTTSDERAATLNAFRQGQIQALTNCLVLTTGYNCPSIDCIAVIRPTASKSLFLQMIGRGSRNAEGKRDCSILDYGGNIQRFAPLSDVWDIHKSPARVEKEEKAEAQARQRRQLAHDTAASLLDPMAEDAPALTLQVDAVTYSLVPSKHPAQVGKTNLKALYRLRNTLHKWVTQFICLEYVGGARFHAARWFERRKQPMPATAAEALQLAKSGAYPLPEAVVVRQDGKYLRVVVEQFATENEK